MSETCLLTEKCGFESGCNEDAIDYMLITIEGIKYKYKVNVCSIHYYYAIRLYPQSIIMLLKTGRLHGSWVDDNFNIVHTCASCGKFIKQNQMMIICAGYKYCSDLCEKRHQEDRYADHI